MLGKRKLSEEGVSRITARDRVVLYLMQDHVSEDILTTLRKEMGASPKSIQDERLVQSKVDAFCKASNDAFECLGNYNESVRDDRWLPEVEANIAQSDANWPSLATEVETY